MNCFAHCSSCKNAIFYGYGNGYGCCLIECRYEPDEYDNRIITSNQTLTEEVVRCKDCKLRETSGCPMYQEEYSKWDDDGYTEVDLIVTDLTEDEGFCHCGTKMDKER